MLLQLFLTIPTLAVLASAGIDVPTATVSLYQDTACATAVPGSGHTEVYADTCDTGPFQTGWSSAKIINAADPNDTITFYTKNNCGCPTCGSHGYSASDGGCLTEFGFTANAVGFAY